MVFLVSLIQIVISFDILSFVDDWTMHKAAYEATAPGNRTLRVGEGIDHYFNGISGLERAFDDRTGQQFSALLAAILAFLDHYLKGAAYAPQAEIPCITLRRDHP